MTQQKLGAMVGVSYRTIRAWEVDGRYPKQSSLYQKLADAFQCRVSYLMDDNETVCLEKKEKRQREGIEAKKLRGEWDDYGRPSVMKQETFDENFQSVVSGETTPTQLRKNLGMTHSTFYRYRKTFYEKYPELSNSAN